MKESEFKVYLFEVFSSNVDGLSYEEKIGYIEKCLIEYQIKNDESRDTPNKGNSWTDEELQVVLSDAPTKSNCIKYAKIFGRGYGSIEQIYRWASTTDKDIKKKRPDDIFVNRVKRIAKEQGWRA